MEKWIEVLLWAAHFSIGMIITKAFGWAALLFLIIYALVIIATYVGNKEV